MFGLHVISNGLMERKWGHFYTAIFECRSEADYEDFRDYSKEEVEEFFPLAIEFVRQIEVLMHEDESSNEMK